MNSSIVEFAPLRFSHRIVARIRWCVFSVAGVVALPGAPREYVTVSATAAPYYQRATNAKNELRPESYLFAPGEYYPGSTRDPGQEKTTFQSIAETLAVGLARQRYLPAEQPENAELLIVVHWGTTPSSENPNKQFELEDANNAVGSFSATRAANELADTSALNAVGALRNGNAEAQQHSLRSIAALLGYDHSLSKEQSSHPVATADEITLLADLSEERYFVVLMAYDYQLMRKEKKRRLLWVSRMSLRSLGTSFSAAIPTMTAVAADFFGQQQDELVRTRAPVRNSKVEIGDLKVVPLKNENDASAPAK